MNFGQAIASGFSNYVNFSSRGSRSEYWLWVLFTVLGGLATGILDSALFSSSAPTSSPLNGIFELVTVLPGVALNVRRLHDINRTGWLVFIVLTIIGIFVLLYWACQKGTCGPNRFGPDRLAELAARISSPRPTA
jgi:uncharacterized membrane protein YhaH (DUF805 family)